MLQPQSRRVVVRLLTVSTLALGLPACGGGSSSATGNENGGAGSANGDLYAAFDLIGKGMSYEQVRDIVGSDFNNGKDDFGGQDVHYKWVAGKGTVNVTLLTVQFKNGGAVAKIVGGNKGNNSKFW